VKLRYESPPPDLIESHGPRIKKDAATNMNGEWLIGGGGNPKPGDQEKRGEPPPQTLFLLRVKEAFTNPHRPTLARSRVRGGHTAGDSFSVGVQKRFSGVMVKPESTKYKRAGVIDWNFL